ncbi:Methionine aminopeptidase 2-1 [Colletotrichum shisoi]|uniref:Methionine aminopeptidase 2 n=1 Tax=Colletotrichum shisoi TaxID=2078593 RepID=A0A5Q4BUV0_9PEZI|nr:Methionine aminopeptidase 2-1 [Colletotrichum shisoi]
MGSKTPDDQIPGGNGGPLSASPSSAGGEPRGAHLSRDGDASLGDQGDDDDDEEDDDDVGSRPLKIDGGPKKKKKPKEEEYPAGEYLAYDKAPPATVNTSRTTAAKLRYRTRRHLEDPELLNDYRKAAEVHRQVRHWVQETVKPGWTLLDIATGIEDGVRSLLANQGIEPGDNLRSGMGFLTGLCLNNETAHYTPNPGQKDVVLQYGDVMKVDYGVQVNGWIVDSAFTMSFDPTYDNLLAAARDATNSGIKAAGIDVRICDVSAEIQGAMESYEVEIRGKTYPVRAVRNICAHDIKRYRIHGGKSIPFIRNNDQTKMEEGEIFAIETFGTTGRGKLYDDVGVYGYGLQHDAPAQVRLPFASANRLYKTIREQFGSIVFCRRYLDRLGLERYLAGLNCLVSNGVLESYAPLADIKGSYSSQFEHTILLRESSKEIMSRGKAAILDADGLAGRAVVGAGHDLVSWFLSRLCHLLPRRRLVFLDVGYAPPGGRFDIEAINRATADAATGEERFRYWDLFAGGPEAVALMDREAASVVSLMHAPPGVMAANLGPRGRAREWVSAICVVAPAAAAAAGDAFATEAYLREKTAVFREGGWTGPTNWYRALRDNLSLEDERDMEKGIRVPVMVVGCGRDEMTTAGLQDQMTRPWAGAGYRLEVLGTGHWVMLEDAAGTNRLLGEFLDRLP